MIRFLHDWLVSRRESRLVIADFQWRDVERTLPFLARLSPDEILRLRAMSRRFIVEKQWSAAQGLELTTEMQLSISLQACLAVLNLGLDWYRGWVGIVIYPGDFVIPRQVEDEAGIIHEYEDEVLGEAWEGGPVLLSWFAPDQQPASTTGLINAVIHEFAHKLDMIHGHPDGLPPLHAGMSRQTWIRTFQNAFDDLNRRLDNSDGSGIDTGIDEYAAESPTEFFAVASETFFTAPERLCRVYPDVYAQLCTFYRQNPGG